MAEEEQGLGVFFRSDVAERLRGLDQANLDLVARFRGSGIRIWRDGFSSAISSVALAFGVDPVDVRGSVEEPAGIPTDFEVIGDSGGQPGD